MDFTQKEALPGKNLDFLLKTLRERMLLLLSLKLHSFPFTAAFNTLLLTVKLINIIFLILLKDTPEKDFSPGKSRRLETDVGAKQLMLCWGRFYFLNITRQYICINCL